MLTDNIKFHPPDVPNNSVTRSSLVDNLLTQSGIKLIIVHAPAGFGKTTLLSQYYDALQKKGEKALWMSLDAADNDLSTFMSLLNQSIQVCMNSNDIADKNNYDNSNNEYRESSDFWNWIITAFSNSSLPNYLFIDEFEVINDAAILETLSAGLLRMPNHRQVIIASRKLPDFSYSKMQINNQVMIIDANALRFNKAECNQFFNNRIDNISPENIDNLLNQTEGWPTALQISSILLLSKNETQKNIIDQLSTNQLFSDYLLENILSKQTDKIREFLLQSCVLRDLNPAVCSFITGQPDTKHTLENLYKNGLFIQKIGENNNYRYHKLFARTLYEYQRKSNPQTIKNLHEKAAQWYLDNSFPNEAIEHSLKAENHELAATIIEKQALKAVYSSQVDTVLKWASSLPADQVARLPCLQLACAWAHAFYRNYDTANEIIINIDHLKKTQEIDKAIIYRIPTLKVTLNILSDHLDGMENTIAKYLKIIPSDAFFERFGLDNTLSFLLLTKDRFESARCVLMATQAVDVPPGYKFAHVYSYTILGLKEIITGQLRQAKQALDKSLALAGNPLEKVVPIPLLAELLYESNEIDSAKLMLEQALPIIRSRLTPDWVLSAFITLARIYALKGESLLALRTLDDLERIGYSDNLPRIIATARWEIVRLHQLEGNFARAEEAIYSISGENISSKIPNHRFHPAELEADDITLIRFYIGQGELTKARELLDQAVSETHEQRKYRLLKLNILNSLIYQAERNLPVALSTLEKTIAGCGEEPFIRSFIDEGRPLVELLNLLRNHIHGKAPSSKNDRLIVKIDELLTHAGSAAQVTAPQPTTQDLVDPLTKRELEFLQMIADGHSNKSIAEEMGVTESTVKWHLGNIYSKMWVKKRTQAIANGRRLGLII